MGPISDPKMSLWNYQSMLHNTPEEHRSCHNLTQMCRTHTTLLSNMHVMSFTHDIFPEISMSKFKADVWES
jgi:hypothetical protein